jgi:protocatechuate 3,4-dioxygenase beta subunit
VVTVNNVSPTVTNVTNNGPISEGGSATITVTATDPAGVNDPLMYEFDCNNDGAYDIGPRVGNNAQCVYTDQGSYIVAVRVTDGDGGSGTGSTTVVVNNVAPQISSVTNNGPINEGSSATITVVATDPAGVNDPLVYEFDCNNDTTYDVGPQAGNTAQCLFAQDGSFTVGVRVSDGDGGVVTDTEVVTVNNVAPVIDSVVNNGPKMPNSPVTVTVSVTDPGTSDVLVYEFDCDNDATYETSQASGVATCTYSTVGPKTVNVRVSDDDTPVTDTTNFDIQIFYLYVPELNRAP